MYNILQENYEGNYKVACRANKLFEFIFWFPKVFFLCLPLKSLLNNGTTSLYESFCDFWAILLFFFHVLFDRLCHVYSHGSVYSANINMYLPSSSFYCIMLCPLRTHDTSQKENNPLKLCRKINPQCMKCKTLVLFPLLIQHRKY